MLRVLKRLSASVCYVVSKISVYCAEELMEGDAPRKDFQEKSFVRILLK